MNPTTVIRPTGSVSDEQARRLLRCIRDLNLGPAGIEVGEGERVVLDGCTSTDSPVEAGVWYRLRQDDRERLLVIRWRDDRLQLALEDRTECQLDVELACDGLGRISAPDLGARLHLEDRSARDIEHFLRRIVRAIHARAARAA